MISYWYDCKIWVKMPFSVGLAVPVLVLYTPETGDYEITKIDYVPIIPGKPRPDWGNLKSETQWLEQWAMPNLWEQIGTQVEEQNE